MVIEKIIQRYATRLNEEQLERIRAHATPLPHTRVRLLGQLSLLADPAFSAAVTLFSTVDFDAWIEGDWRAKQILSEVLRDYGLQYDELSGEIWMPEETEWRTMYANADLEFQTAMPLYTIVSKAVKAPEKNEQLLQAASALFGSELLALVRKYQKGSRQ